MEINGKTILYGLLISFILLFVLVSLGIVKPDFSKASPASSGDYGSMPEKCRPPGGQDVSAWKEHLGHHAETKDCLKYF